MQDNFSLSLLGIAQKYLIPMRFMLAAFLGLHLASIILCLFIPRLLSGMVDNAISANDFAMIFKYGIFMGIAYFLWSISSYLSSVFSAKISAKAYIKFVNDLIRHIQSVPVGKITSDSSYLASQLTDDTEEILSFILNNFAMVCVDIVILILISIILFIECGIIISVIFIITSLLSWIIYKIYRQYINKTSYERKESQNNLFSLLNSQLQNIKFIKAYSIGKFLSEQSTSYYNYFINIMIKYGIVNNAYIYSSKLFKNIAIVICMLIGGIAVVNGKLSLGLLLAAIAYYEIGFRTLDDFQNLGSEYGKIKTALQRINKIITTQQELSGNQRPLINSLKIRNLSFSYGNGRNNLDNLNLSFEKNKFYLIVGENGAGKSTLIDLILRFYEPDSGEILINDIDIREINLNYLRSELIAWMEQSPVILNLDFEKNLTLGDPTRNPDNFLKKFPVLSAVAFSGGEKQKIALIRCLLKNAPIVILDEPTANMDDKAVQTLISILGEMQEKIVLIVSHDQRLLACHNMQQVILPHPQDYPHKILNTR